MYVYMTLSSFFSSGLEKRSGGTCGKEAKNRTACRISGFFPVACGMPYAALKDY